MAGPLARLGLVAGLALALLLAAGAASAQGRNPSLPPHVSNQELVGETFTQILKDETRINDALASLRKKVCFKSRLEVIYAYATLLDYSSLLSGDLQSLDSYASLVSAGQLAGVQAGQLAGPRAGVAKLKADVDKEAARLRALKPCVPEPDSYIQPPPKPQPYDGKDFTREFNEIDESALRFLAVSRKLKCLDGSPESEHRAVSYMRLNIESLKDTNQFLANLAAYKDKAGASFQTLFDEASSLVNTVTEEIKRLDSLPPCVVPPPPPPPPPPAGLGGAPAPAAVGATTGGTTTAGPPVPPPADDPYTDTGGLGHVLDKIAEDKHVVDDPTVDPPKLNKPRKEDEGDETPSEPR